MGPTCFCCCIAVLSNHSSSYAIWTAQGVCSMLGWRLCREMALHFIITYSPISTGETTLSAKIQKKSPLTAMILSVPKIAVSSSVSGRKSPTPIPDGHNRPLVVTDYPIKRKPCERFVKSYLYGSILIRIACRRHLYCRLQSHPPPTRTPVLLACVARPSRGGEWEGGLSSFPLPSSGGPSYAGYCPPSSALMLWLPCCVCVG